MKVAICWRVSVAFGTVECLRLFILASGQIRYLTIGVAELTARVLISRLTDVIGIAHTVELAASIPDTVAGGVDTDVDRVGGKLGLGGVGTRP